MLLKKSKFLFKALFILGSVSFLLFSCTEEDDEDLIGNWINRSVFDGTPRSSAAYFSIGNKGYVGVGYDGEDYRSDFWEYNMDGDYWTQKADFPGVARSSAVGMAINEVGYIGSGYDGLNNLGDFYQYNPTTNTWTQIADFPENPRRGAVAFGINGFGYFGTGFDGDNYRKDFWKYNPTTNMWSEQTGFGGNKRKDASTFTIGSNVYIGGGVSNGTLLTDFWVMNTDTGTFTKLLNLNVEDDYNVIRSNAVGFSLNGKGYFACGYASGSVSTVWEYNPSDDTWEEKTAFEGTTRQDPIVMTNGTQAFVGMGRSGTLYLDDFDEFFPNAEYDDED